MSFFFLLLNTGKIHWHGVIVALHVTKIERQLRQWINLIVLQMQSLLKKILSTEYSTEKWFCQSSMRFRDLTWNWWRTLLVNVSHLLSSPVLTHSHHIQLNFIRIYIFVFSTSTFHNRNHFRCFIRNKLYSAHTA